ncbi:DUF421 domain-containing protein [Alicyclobacillus mengziensis]|uniref:DUF421 domain-containing protein n=1 Tax=Alicyclobacillus mengziensis TaxID=2931921 RepID=A0A9X7W1D5_9BACL|nr:DUF421 domain-containing protein [Alicyclobacillus mengziensis]QSO47573.1 DUF421 domain-containing protein [Alicyclobacillus mengziensis]
MAHVEVLIFLHSIATFIGLVILARLLKQNLMTLIAFGLAAMAGVASLNGRVPWSDWLVATVTWILLTLLIQLASLKSPQFATLVGQQPTIVVQGGKVLEDNLRKAQTPLSQLLSMLRQKNAFQVADVEMGVLEPDGQLSVLLKSESQPVTPKQLNIPVENTAAPVDIVIDGMVQAQALTQLGVSRSWLAEELRRKQITDIRAVMLAQVDGNGIVHVDLYDDTSTAPPTRSNAHPSTLATLKKAQADLESFAMETQNPAAKQLYTTCAQSLQRVIAQTTPFLEEPK